MTPKSIDIDSMRMLAPNADKPPCDICEDSGEWCKYCNPRPPLDNRPLLAQCAALLARCDDLTTSLLGGPIATHGLIDEIRSVQEEIRRIRAELAKEGL